MSSATVLPGERQSLPVQVFYPSAARIDDAKAVHLPAGAETRGLDLTLIASSATPGPLVPPAQPDAPPGDGRIAGRVLAADSGKPLKGALLQLVSFSDAGKSARTDLQGRFEFSRRSREISGDGSRRPVCQRRPTANRPTDAVRPIDLREHGHLPRRDRDAAHEARSRNLRFWSTSSGDRRPDLVQAAQSMFRCQRAHAPHADRPSSATERRQRAFPPFEPALRAAVTSPACQAPLAA